MCAFPLGRFLVLALACACMCRLDLRAEEAGTKDVSPSEKVTAQFRDIARALFLEMLVELSAEQLQQAEKELKSEPGKLPDKMGEMFMTQYKAAFTLSEDQSRKLLGGEFDNAANTERTKKALEVFAALKVPLPGPVPALMKKFQAGELKDLKLEFTARFFQMLVSRIKSALEQELPEKK